MSMSATPVNDWMKCLGLNRHNAAKKLGIPLSTFYELCRDKECFVIDGRLATIHPSNNLRESRK